MFELLSHPDPLERLGALDAYSRAADPQTRAQAAATLLADPDRGVREQAARRLAAQADDAAARATAPFITCADLGVRNLAGEVLVKLGAPAVAVLLPYLDDPDADVRKFAVDVLALLPAQTATPAIAACLHDVDENVQLAAVDALAALGASEYADAMAVLYDHQPLTRANIVTAFGLFGTHLHRLEQALGDDDPVVQLAAAEALSRWDRPEVLDTLLRTLEAADPMVRPVMLHSIVRLCEGAVALADRLPAAFPDYLIALLDDPDETYRQTAARGLRLGYTPDAVDALIRHIGPHDALNLEIFQTLAVTPVALSHLSTLAETEALPVEPVAQIMLGLLAGGRPDPSAWAATARFLADRFDQFSLDTRIAALNLCQQYDDPAFQPVIEAGWNDPDPAITAFLAAA